MIDDETKTNQYARAGSQRWLQAAVNNAPDLLADALSPALDMASQDTVLWRSPLQADKFAEYRDDAALHKLGIEHLPQRSLSEFWPRLGPVWDALANTSDGQYVFVEAKAHLKELETDPSGATNNSLEFIRKSLGEARQHFASGVKTDWSGKYYQYANRLAHHYLFRVVNGLPSHLVFLYFINATDTGGPKSEAEWRPKIQELHRSLGLPEELEQDGVHEIFFDVANLSNVGSGN